MDKISPLVFVICSVTNRHTLPNKHRWENPPGESRWLHAKNVVSVLCPPIQKFLRRFQNRFPRDNFHHVVYLPLVALVPDRRTVRNATARIRMDNTLPIHKICGDLREITVGIYGNSELQKHNFIYLNIRSFKPHTHRGRREMLIQQQ